jgi:hypothetical protein
MKLDAFVKTKRNFDVNSKKDIEIFTEFMKKSAWGPDCCPFLLEFPFLSVPDMIKSKLVNKVLKLT